MPTKRRFIIFLIVLTLMLLIKRAVGQEAAVGWDPESCWDCGPSLEDQILVTMIGGVIFGMMAGVCRVIERGQAARQDRYFTGDLIQLRLR
ncbi:MAG TPA: hypothetical protein VM009_02600 [Terriglobales bacterium]|nr:hypothetical protein [Terriglobales bacterium]